MAKQPEVNWWQQNREHCQSHGESTSGNTMDSHDHAGRRSEVNWWQQNRDLWQPHRESTNGNTNRVNMTMLIDDQKSTGDNKREIIDSHTVRSQQVATQ